VRAAPRTGQKPDKAFFDREWGRIEIRDYRAHSIPLAIIGREKFGTGRRGLNMGDCLLYGAAKRNRARLLYVGEDFALTDVNDGA
jgi:ribonuclease VapC